jgi:hypothetical protein
MGLLILGLVCVCLGVVTRVKASRAATKLRTWQRTDARVESVQNVSERSGRHGRTTRYVTTVRYDTPRGQLVRTIKLNNRPMTSTVGVYYNPADPEENPQAEAHLLSSTSTANLRIADALTVGGLVVTGACVYFFRRRMWAARTLT